MGFCVEQYAKVRPTLWHLTNHDNLKSIRESRTLFPAEHFIAATSDFPRRRRVVTSDGIVIRDQALLHERCIQFDAGYSFCLFVRNLNSRVFFWAGWQDRPVIAGRRAIAHYRDSDVLIRVPFIDIAASYSPFFSQCNSGAPRMQHGKTVLRGKRTFLAAAECEFPATEVVEVTFAHPVTLPATSEIALPGDRWECL